MKRNEMEMEKGRGRGDRRWSGLFGVRTYFCNSIARGHGPEFGALGGSCGFLLVCLACPLAGAALLSCRAGRWGDRGACFPMLVVVATSGAVDIFLYLYTVSYKTVDRPSPQAIRSHRFGFRRGGYPSAFLLVLFFGRPAHYFYYRAH